MLDFVFAVKGLDFVMVVNNKPHGGVSGILDYKEDDAIDISNNVVEIGKFKIMVLIGSHFKPACVCVIP